MGYNYRPLKLRMPKRLVPVAAVDSDWAADWNDHKSTSSHLTTIGGNALVNFQSKKQGIVALFSTEVELYAESIATSDLRFVNNQLTKIFGKPPSEPMLL